MISNKFYRRPTGNQQKFDNATKQTYNFVLPDTSDTNGIKVIGLVLTLFANSQKEITRKDGTTPYELELYFDNPLTNSAA
ncbi:hypothetical protein OF377_02870 [Ureaplasma sp. ES3154-GEN]|uniref:hypothetical protein n=1 Tax=Ureaplasma sp. ES3154-GEN TaxID=2984844 RepID=UPI0021E80DB4|nr:hypothetical protein [Ureaplasma sp. ES3154-GEN]MCV3743804.1 hypothetical protein [Ureaplasma sp. ES3154-GEN]